MEIDNPKILFLHGLGQNKESFNETIKLIDFKDIKNINLIPDCSYNLTFFDIANILENEIRDIKQPIVICGLSLGAILALELYFRKPEKISGLILIAPQYKIPKIIISLQNFIFKIMPEKFFEETNISKNNMISIASSLKDLDYSKKLAKYQQMFLYFVDKKIRWI